MVRRMKSSKMRRSSKGLYIVKNNGTIQVESEQERIKFDDWTQIYADDPDFKYGNSQIIKYQNCICFKKIRPPINSD